MLHRVLTRTSPLTSLYSSLSRASLSPPRAPSGLLYTSTLAFFSTSPRFPSGHSFRPAMTPRRTPSLALFSTTPKAPGTPPESTPSTPPPSLWSQYNPGALFKKALDLGPMAIILYAGTWAVPLVGIYVPLSTGMLTAPDPLLFCDANLPAVVGNTTREGLKFLGVVVEEGKPLPASISAGIWAYLVADLIEIPRLAFILYFTPKVKKYVGW